MNSGHSSRRAAAEAARILLVAAVAVAAAWPLFTRWLSGSIDARWYAYMLKDFIDQERAGHLPVFLGQGAYAWNGGVHPFRSAPVYMAVAGLWDLLTLRSLGLPWLQHLTAITATLAGALGFYAGAAALAPRRRTEAALLALLYVIGGGWICDLYWSDAYMTYMAMAAFPLVVYGNARALLSADGEGYGFLAAGLALTWMCHPPVAMLACLGTALLQGGRLLCGEVSPRRLRRGLGAAALFAGMAAYYFASMSELPEHPTTLSLRPELGLALALAGIAVGGVRGRWPWLLLLAPAAWLLGAADLPWLWWMAFTGALAVAAAALARWRGWFDPGRWTCEILLPAALAGAGLAGAILGPGRSGIDGPALSALRDNADSGSPFAWIPPSETRLNAHLLLGPGCWLVLALLGWAFCRKRPLAAKLWFAAAVWPVLGLVRVPWASNFLAASFPLDLQGICNFPFGLRLVPAFASFVVMGGAVWLATEPEGSGRLRPWIAGLLALTVAWAGVKSAGYVERGLDTVSNRPRTAKNFRSENVILDRYAYDLLPIPSYYSNGVTDPRLELRLLGADQRVVFGPDDAARAMEAAGRREIHLTSRQDPTAARWLRIEPDLTLAPGEHVLLRFEFLPGRSYAGYLILRSEHGYREYHLPDSGYAKAFGVGLGRTHVISLWNSGSEPEHYVFSMPREAGNDLDAGGGAFATLFVSEYRGSLAAVRLESLDPMRVAVRATKPGWLETPRVFLPGYQADVDGRPAAVARSAELLVMVPLPAGAHRVELRYAGTRRLWLAAAVSLIAWTAAGLGLLWGCGRSWEPVRNFVESQLFWRLVRYAVVGATVMIAFMGLNWLFGHRCGKQVAFLLSYPPALGLHFYLNKRWTFTSRRADTGRQIGEYLAMVAVTFAVQWGVFTALVTWTALPGWLAAGLANAAQMAITFVVMQRRIFAAPRAP